MYAKIIPRNALTRVSGFVPEMKFHFAALHHEKGHRWDVSYLITTASQGSRKYLRTAQFQALTVYLSRKADLPSS